MADPTKLGRVAAARAKAVDGAQNEPANKLDSVVEQEAILNPKPIEATVGGRPVDIYKLSFKDVRKMRALMTVVFAEASGPGPVFARLSGTLGLNDKLRNQFIGIVARAMFPADATEAQLANVEKVAQEIDDKADFDELARLMLVMAERNPFEGTTAPK